MERGGKEINRLKYKSKKRGKGKDREEEMEGGREEKEDQVE